MSQELATRVADAGISFARPWRTEISLGSADLDRADAKPATEGLDVAAQTRWWPETGEQRSDWVGTRHSGTIFAGMLQPLLFTLLPSFALATERRHFLVSGNVELVSGAKASVPTAFALPPRLTLAQGDFLSSLSELRAAAFSSAPFWRFATMASETVSFLMTARGEPSAQLLEPAAHLARQYDDVIKWLQLTTLEMRQATGIGRSTRFYWQTNTPRATTGRHLEPVYALVRAIVDELGVAGARGWFHHGKPSGIDLLVSGDIATLTRRAHGIVFRGTETAALASLRSQIAWDEAEGEEDAGVPAEDMSAFRRKTRPRRKMLSDDR
jgi:hypothetical protein